MEVRRLKAIVNMFALIVIFTSSAIFQGCSGCSPSGRRNHQKASSASTNDYSSRTEGMQHSSKQGVSKNVIPNIKFLPLNELYNNYKESVFLVYTSDGNSGFQGSGFFISKDGLAVSNYHVFEGTYQGLEVIETLDGKQLKIKEVIEKSKDDDYIIFRVKIDNYNTVRPIPIVVGAPQIGEDVFAIGNPRGLESTLSKGIVSAFRDNNTLIQTTAEITHGSSGGPLINMKGEVIGITTAGMGEANLNFAVNIKILKLYRFL